MCVGFSSSLEAVFNFYFRSGQTAFLSDQLDTVLRDICNGVSHSVLFKVRDRRSTHGRLLIKHGVCKLTGYPLSSPRRSLCYKKGSIFVELNRQLLNYEQYDLRPCFNELLLLTKHTLKCSIVRMKAFVLSKK